MSRWLIAALSATLLAGCHSLPFTGDKTGPKYNDAKTLQPLDVPPDLIAAPVKPGLTVPPATSAGPAVSPAASGVGADNGGGFPLSQRGQAPAPAPTAAQPAGAVPASRLTAEGKAPVLHVAMPASALWPIIQATLSKEGYGIAKLDKSSGVLETNWKGSRTGLSAIFGSAVAPNARQKFILTLRSEGGDQQALSARQIRQDSDTEATGEAWTSTPADPARSVALLKDIQAAIKQNRVTAAMPAIKVERLQDQNGPYLVLGLPPASAQGPVLSALQSLGYTQIKPGEHAGEWLISVDETQAKAKQGVFSDILSQLSEGVRGIFGQGKKAAGPTQLLVRLSRDRQSPGSVLEVVPVNVKDKADKALANALIQSLAERLNQPKA